MTWPVGRVLLATLPLDAPNAQPGALAGVIPGDTANPSAQGAPSIPLANAGDIGYRQSARPVCIPVPYPYDDAGYAYPAGSLLVISGDMNQPTGSGGVVPGGSRITLVGTQDLAVIKHLFPLHVSIVGLPADTTGTITIGHTADYSVGAPTVNDITWAFTGADGPNQVAFLLTPLSVPAARKESDRSFQIEAIWTGTAPDSVTVDYNHPGVNHGRVVPDALPVGYTARAGADDLHGGYWGSGWRGFRAAFPRKSEAVHPSNWPFYMGILATGTASGLSTSSKSETSEGYGCHSQLLGSAEPWRIPDLLAGALAVVPFEPCFWSGDALVRMPYQSTAFGVVVDDSGASTPFLSDIPDGTTQTKTSIILTPTLAAGPGYRNIRAYCKHLSSVNLTLNSMVFRFYIDGILTTTFGPSAGPFGDQDYIDCGSVLPAAAVARGVLTYDFDASFTNSSGGAQTPQIEIVIKASPRCDIPLTFTSVGPANECAPGGYLPTFVATPLSSGETMHLAAGVTSYDFPAIGVDLSQHASRALTFLPGTTGVYRIDSTGADSGFNRTLGEYEFINTPHKHAIGRAGKRFWGHHADSFATEAATWSLVAIAQVQTDIPSGGLTVAGGHLTDGGWFFGTIALPAAGRYRVTAPCVVGSGLLLALSASDPYCADHLDGPYAIVDEDTSGTTQSISADITVTGMATVYVRLGRWDPFSTSGYDENSPLVALSGDVTWALVG